MMIMTDKKIYVLLAFLVSLILADVLFLDYIKLYKMESLFTVSITISIYVLTLELIRKKAYKKINQENSFYPIYFNWLGKNWFILLILSAVFLFVYSKYSVFSLAGGIFFIIVGLFGTIGTYKGVSFISESIRYKYWEEAFSDRRAKIFSYTLSLISIAIGIVIIAAVVFS